MMTIRDRWNAQADEFNQFDSLGVDEVEKFADEQIEALQSENKALRLDCVGTMIGQRELYLTNENAVLINMVQGMQAELAALKKDARWMAEYTLVLRSEHSVAIEVANRILEATKGGE